MGAVDKLEGRVGRQIIVLGLALDRCHLYMYVRARIQFTIDQNNFGSNPSLLIYRRTEFGRLIKIRNNVVQRRLRSYVPQAISGRFKYAF